MIEIRKAVRTLLVVTATISECWSTSVGVIIQNIWNYIVGLLISSISLSSQIASRKSNWCSIFFFTTSVVVTWNVYFYFIVFVVWKIVVLFLTIVDFNLPQQGAWFEKHAGKCRYFLNRYVYFTSRAS